MSLIWRKRLAYFWRQYAKPFLFVAIILTAFRSSVADWNDVPTGSMRPTILEGDRIFVNKLAYDLKVPYTTVHLASWSNPHRGDVVVFFSPADGVRLVKRVIAVPGDTVSMERGMLIINGQRAQYQPLDAAIAGQVEESQHPGFKLDWENLNGQKHPVIFMPPFLGMDPRSRHFDPIKVPEGKYFVMGDNRDNSRDSRFIGMIDRESIVGRASAVVTSLDSLNHYAPRWSRFFKALP